MQRRFRPSKKRRSTQALKNHKRQTAREILHALREQNLAEEEKIPVVLGTLRRIDPLVFEELLLHVFAEDGFQVQRNPRYTGDGGIDGRFRCGEHLFLIQAKRYKGAIQANHLVDFCRVVLQEQAHKGLFIHTGTTGPLSRQLACMAAQHVTIISGMTLVDFVLHGTAGYEARLL